MDIKPYQDKFKKWFLKYRYVALIVLIGLIFLLIPGTADKEDSKPVVPAITEDDTPLYAELSDILSAVEGAGRVEVLLTVSQGEATVYQANTFSAISVIVTKAISFSPTSISNNFCSTINCKINSKCGIGNS